MGNIIVLLVLLICLVSVAAALFEVQGSYVGVVGKNLTLTWKYIGEKDPTEVTFLISNDDKHFSKIWSLKMSSGQFSRTKIQLTPGSSSYIFDNITALEIIDKYLFRLHIKSVPRNITSFKFVCLVQDGPWKSHRKSTTVQLADPPVLNFTIGKGKKPIAKGNHVEMTCSAKGFPAPRVYLQRYVDSKLITLNDSIAKSSFSVPSIQPSDAGRYVCRAVNVAAQVKKEIAVTVQFLDTNQLPTLTIPAKQGSKIDLKCKIVGFPEPNYSWYKDKQILLGANSKILTVDLKSSSEFGSYTCTGMNVEGTHQNSFNFVEIYIKVTDVSFTLQSKIGDKRVLECPIQGHPQIEYMWYKDSKKIGDKKAVHLTLKKSDFGTYICSARNSAGTASTNIRLEQSPVNLAREIPGNTKSASSKLNVSTLAFICTTILVFIAS